MTWLFAVLLPLLLETSNADWKLVTALLTSNAVLSSVIGILWWRYNQARDKYDNLLIKDRNELVPEMLRLAQVAKELNTSATKLLEESIKLRTYRRGGAPPEISNEGS